MKSKDYLKRQLTFQFQPKKKKIVRATYDNNNHYYDYYGNETVEYKEIKHLNGDHYYMIVKRNGEMEIQNIIRQQQFGSLVVNNNRNGLYYSE